MCGKDIRRDKRLDGSDARQLQVPSRWLCDTDGHQRRGEVSERDNGCQQWHPEVVVGLIVK